MLFTAHLCHHVRGKIFCFLLCFVLCRLENRWNLYSENKDKESVSVTINRLMKVRQVISYEKVEHTSEIIDNCLEQGKKIIVFTNFTMTVDMLHEKYKKNFCILFELLN